MHRELAVHHVVAYEPNAQFNQALLRFADGSFLQFEHIGRDRRWVQASADGTMADQVIRSLKQFRLNAKHLQLFFVDGSDAEFGRNEKE
jgi:hypothetical protein